jgi:hypothetical protein
LIVAGFVFATVVVFGSYIALIASADLLGAALPYIFLIAHTALFVLWTRYIALRRSLSWKEIAGYGLTDAVLVFAVMLYLAIQTYGAWGPPPHCFNCGFFTSTT